MAYNPGDDGYTERPTMEAYADIHQMKQEGYSDQEIISYMKNNHKLWFWSPTDLNSMYNSTDKGSIERYIAQKNLEGIKDYPLTKDSFFVDTQEEADRKNALSMGRQKYFVRPDPTKNVENSGDIYNEWYNQQTRLDQKRKDDIEKIHTSLGWAPPAFEGGEPDYSDIEKAYTEQGIYKGQVPMGSAVVDGKLIGGQPIQAQQPAQQKPMFTSGADVQGAPLMMPQSIQTPTPSGGVSRSYSAVGGSKFQPKEEEKNQQQMNYGGGNIGYGGNIQYNRKF